MLIACPRCGTKANVRTDAPGECARCGNCGEALTTAARRADAAPPYLRAIAMLPLGVAIIAIATKLLGGGLVGGAAWGAFGGASAAVAHAHALRPGWSSNSWRPWSHPNGPS